MSRRLRSLLRIRSGRSARLRLAHFRQCARSLGESENSCWVGSRRETGGCSQRLFWPERLPQIRAYLRAFGERGVTTSSGFFSAARLTCSFFLLFPMTGRRYRPAALADLPSRPLSTGFSANAGGSAGYLSRLSNFTLRAPLQFAHEGPRRCQISCILYTAICMIRLPYRGSGIAPIKAWNPRQLQEYPRHIKKQNRAINMMRLGVYGAFQHAPSDRCPSATNSYRTGFSGTGGGRRRSGYTLKPRTRFQKQPYGTRNMYWGCASAARHRSSFSY